MFIVTEYAALRNRLALVVMCCSIYYRLATRRYLVDKTETQCATGRGILILCQHAFLIQTETNENMNYSFSAYKDSSILNALEFPVNLARTENRCFT